MVHVVESPSLAVLSQDGMCFQQSCSSPGQTQAIGQRMDLIRAISQLISGDQKTCDNIFCHSSSMTLGDQTSKVYEMGSDTAYQGHNISM